MIKITLKDGSVKEFDHAITAGDAAKEISMGLFRAACAAEIDGKVCDLRTLIDHDATLAILTFEQD
ncbi:MAG: TGS domain-containing protein, partial [Angelakisella sp.]